MTRSFLRAYSCVLKFSLIFYDANKLQDQLTASEKSIDREELIPSVAKYTKNGGDLIQFPADFHWVALGPAGFRDRLTPYFVRQYAGNATWTPSWSRLNALLVSTDRSETPFSTKVTQKSLKGHQKSPKSHPKSLNNH